MALTVEVRKVGDLRFFKQKVRRKICHGLTYYSDMRKAMPLVLIEGRSVMASKLLTRK